MAISTKKLTLTGLTIAGIAGAVLLLTPNAVVDVANDPVAKKILIDSLQKEAIKIVFTWNPSIGRKLVLPETAPGEMYYPNGIPNALPGDTYIVPAKLYSVIQIGNTRGTRENPITIINDTAGQVVCPAIRIKNDCEWIWINGQGSSHVLYGFKGNMAKSVYKHIRTTRFEGAFGNNGIFDQQVPDSSDRRTYYIAGSPNNYKWECDWIEYCWLHDNNGEALYDKSTSCNRFDNGMIPARSDSTLVENCIVQNAAWDGLQMANGGISWMRRNTVYNFGTINKGVQQAGGIFGNGTKGFIVYNTFTKGTGNGFELFGNGTLYFAHNVIDSAGRDLTTVGQESLIAQDMIDSVSGLGVKQRVIIFHNTIKNPQSKGAIKIYADNNNSLPSIIDSNNFIIPNAGSDWITKYIFNNVPNSSFIGNVLNGAIDTSGNGGHDSTDIHPPVKDSVFIGTTTLGTIQYKIPVTNNHKIPTTTSLFISSDSMGYYSSVMSRSGKLVDTFGYSSARNPFWVKFKIKNNLNKVIDSTKISRLR